MNKNGYTTSWRAKERIETLDLPLAEDPDQPVWVKRDPDELEDNLTPEQAFDILFGYAEERHRNDPCAHPAPELAHTKNLKPIL